MFIITRFYYITKFLIQVYLFITNLYKLINWLFGLKVIPFDHALNVHIMVLLTIFGIFVIYQLLKFMCTCCKMICNGLILVGFIILLIGIMVNPNNTEISN